MWNLFALCFCVLYFFSPSLGIYVATVGGVRIVSNNSNCNFGRAEFYTYNTSTLDYRWGSFSGDYWDTDTTGSFCGTLGFSLSGNYFYATTAFDNAVGGQASAVSYDYSFCGGANYNICSICTLYYSGYNTYNPHSYDIYVKCAGSTTTSCISYSTLSSTGSVKCTSYFSFSIKGLATAIIIVIVVIIVGCCGSICFCIIICIFCPIWCCVRANQQPPLATSIITTSQPQMYGNMPQYPQGYQVQMGTPQYPQTDQVQTNQVQTNQVQMPTSQFPQTNQVQMPTSQIPQGNQVQMPMSQFPQGNQVQMPMSQFPQSGQVQMPNQYSPPIQPASNQFGNSNTSMYPVVNYAPVGQSVSTPPAASNNFVIPVGNSEIPASNGEGFNGSSPSS